MLLAIKKNVSKVKRSTRRKAGALIWAPAKGNFLVVLK